MVVTDSKSLTLIDDLIHDCWFDVEKVRLQDSVVTIEFHEPDPDSLKGWKRFGPVASMPARRRGILRFEDVQDLTIDDTAGVGSYDLNRLSYDADTRTLAVLTNIPLDLRMTLRTLSVRVDLAAVD